MLNLLIRFHSRGLTYVGKAVFTLEVYTFRGH